MRHMKRRVMIRMLVNSAAPVVGRLRSGAAFLKGALEANLAEAGVVPRNSLAIAIARDHISVAYASAFLSRSSVTKIETAPFAEEGYPSPDDVASAAAVIKENLGLGRVDTRMVIPKAWAMVRLVELPSAAGESLGRVVSYEMDRLSPFNPEAVFYDYHVVTRDEQKIALLLSAAKKETVQPYLNALKEKGIDVKTVGIDLLDAASLCGDGAKGASVFLRIDDEGIEGCSLVHGLVASVLPNVRNRRDGRQTGGDVDVGRIGRFLGNDRDERNSSGDRAMG